MIGRKEKEPCFKSMAFMQASKEIKEEIQESAANPKGLHRNQAQFYHTRKKKPLPVADEATRNSEVCNIKRQ
jgi:hypothetical protein